MFYHASTTKIDTGKPYLIKIGDYCKITRGVTILAHDYGVSVPRRKHGKFIGGSLPVTIGDNVFIGINATILMGTTIGNDCIIGANSVVKGDFPDGVVIAGNPAKVIMTVEDYYKRNEEKWVENAKRCALAIYKNVGRKPTVREMHDGYFWLYMPHTQKSIDDYKNFFELTADDYDDICKEFLNSKPIYNSFDDFLKDCGIE